MTDESEEKEQINLEISIHAAAGLERLARQFKITAAEVLEKLITKADSAEGHKASKRGLGSLYYDGPK